MIAGFVSIVLFNFVFKEMRDIGEYIVALDILAPSFAVAMIAGAIVSKIYPPRAEAVKMIEKIDAASTISTEVIDDELTGKIEE